MLRTIEFNDKRFEKEDFNNVFSPVSKNTIILCNNAGLMHSLADEIIKTVNGEAEYNYYDCDSKDVGQAKDTLRFGLQRIISINKQKITLALEPAIIYKASRAEDIWFADSYGVNGDTDSPYRKSIYPMLAFIGSKAVWNKGKDEVYKTICSGQYGTYDGNWVVLK